MVVDGMPLEEGTAGASFSTTVGLVYQCSRLFRCWMGVLPQPLVDPCCWKGVPPPSAVTLIKDSSVHRRAVRARILERASILPWNVFT
jgi:hypothetical protein